MTQDLSSKVGIAKEIEGSATVTHADGTKEPLTEGMPVFLDDTIETSATGAVNITFNDDTVFAVSEGAKMVIDEYVYDPAKDGEGRADISVIHGAFVYTSGFVGKEDPSDVTIKTPVGSIGIRGTTIAGHIPADGSLENTKITLIEGAIKVTPNGGGEFFLKQEGESIQINPTTQLGTHTGIMPPEQILETFNVVRSVAPQLFAPVVDNVLHDAPADDEAHPSPQEDQGKEKPGPHLPEASDPQEPSPADLQGDPALSPEPTSSDSSLLFLEADMLSPLGGDETVLLMGDPLLAPLGMESTSLLLEPILIPSPPPPETTVIGTLPPPPGSGTFFTGTNAAPVAKVLPTHIAFEQPAIECGTFTFDTSNFFFDPDRDAIRLVVGSLADPGGAISGYGVNANNQLQFTVSNAMSSDSVVKFYIFASDGRVNSPATEFQFTVYNSNLPGSSITSGDDTINITTGGGYRFSTQSGDDTVSISVSANNVVFGGDGNDVLSSDSNGNKLYGEEGNDTLTISGGSNNAISGGNGNDSLSVLGGSSSTVFGGAGNDIITLNGTTAADLQVNATMVDAGSEFDTLALNGVSSLDFSTITATSLHGIEKIKLVGVGTNTTLSLNTADIFQHTGGHELYIDLGADAGDTLIVDGGTLSSSWSSLGGGYSDPSGVAGYTAYSNGVDTLYVKAGGGDTVI